MSRRRHRWLQVCLLKKPRSNWITAVPHRISPGINNRYPKNLIKPTFFSNTTMLGAYLWINMVAINVGSMSRMIFQPCPTMFLPCCFLKMWIILCLFFIHLKVVKSNHQSQEAFQVVMSRLCRGRYLRKHQVKSMIRQGVYNVNRRHPTFDQLAV